MCNICATLFIVVEVIMILSLISGEEGTWVSESSSEITVEDWLETERSTAGFAEEHSTPAAGTGGIYDVITSTSSPGTTVEVRNDSNHDHVYISLNDITERVLELWNRQMRSFGNPVKVLPPARFSCYGKEIILGRSFLTGMDSLHRTEDCVASLCVEDESLTVSLNWGFRLHLRLVPYTRIGDEVMSTSYRVWNSSYSLVYSVGFRTGCRVKVLHLGVSSPGWVQLWASRQGHDDRDFTACYSEALLPGVNRRLEQAKMRLQRALQEVVCNSLYSPFKESVWDSFQEKIAAEQQVNLIFSLLIADNSMPEGY